MRIDLTYAEALERHPVQVEQAMAKLRASKSKWKAALPEQLKWSIEWCVSCTVVDPVAYMLTPKCPDLSDKAKWVREEAQRVRACLQCRIAHAYGNGNFGQVPDEILDLLGEQYDRRKAEEDRVAALTPEQREQETQEALRTLFGGRGFVAITSKGVARNMDEYEKIKE